MSLSQTVLCMAVWSAGPWGHQPLCLLGNLRWSCAIGRLKFNRLLCRPPAVEKAMEHFRESLFCCLVVWRVPRCLHNLSIILYLPRGHSHRPGAKHEHGRLGGPAMVTDFPAPSLALRLFALWLLKVSSGYTIPTSTGRWSLSEVRFTSRCIHSQCIVKVTPTILHNSWLVV